MFSMKQSSYGMSLLNRVEGDEILMAMGVYDALGGTIAEQEGAEAVYMSGSSVATSITGEPDVGLTTMTEMARRAHEISGATKIPLLADADTGYGNPLNVRRTVREYERAGVDAIQIEDQTFPKKCGHFEGKDVIPAEEFAQKIRAGVDARESDEFLIIARTDALAVNGIEEAIERAKRYRKAGADINFVEAPTSREQMERIVEEVPGPHLANMTYDGETPLLSAAELEEIGYDIAIYPATVSKGAMKLFQRIYRSILTEGSQEAIKDEIANWDERNEITGLQRINDLEERYTTE